MASNFGPEIKSAMESPADRARDKAKGIKEGSPQDQKLDAMPQNQMPRPPRPTQAMSGPPPQNVPPAGVSGMRNPSGLPPDIHRVSHAAGIAHAILAGRGV
jgi:hypothetical protein